jgi:hypothetical protein
MDLGYLAVGRSEDGGFIVITGLLMLILTWLVGLLPAWNPIGWSSEYVVGLLDVPIIGDAIGMMLYFNHYAPVSEALGLLGVTLAALVIGQVYGALMWVWRNLPGKAT